MRRVIIATLAAVGVETCTHGSPQRVPFCLQDASDFEPRRPGGQQLQLPTDKLSCKLRASKKALKKPPLPVVLVSCGSFNPPTFMHLRMFELAADHLTQAGYDVLGGYMSPVNDAYAKSGLASAKDRIAMVQAAAGSSELVMVDEWEASQPVYQRSLVVLRRVRDCLQSACGASPSAAEPAPRVMLLCGSDLVESFARPGVWLPEQLRAIFEEHGVVCVSRHAATLHSLALGDGSLLREFRKDILFVEEPVQNDVSSTLVRRLVAEGQSVKYLTPDPVINYINKRGLYKATEIDADF